MGEWEGDHRVPRLRVQRYLRMEGTRLRIGGHTDMRTTSQPALTVYLDEHIISWPLSSTQCTCTDRQEVDKTDPT